MSMYTCMQVTWKSSHIKFLICFDLFPITTNIIYDAGIIRKVKENLFEIVRRKLILPKFVYRQDKSDECRGFKISQKTEKNKLLRRQSMYFEINNSHRGKVVVADLQSVVWLILPLAQSVSGDQVNTVIRNPDWSHKCTHPFPLKLCITYLKLKP